MFFSGTRGVASPILVLSEAGLLHIPENQECQQLLEMVHPVMRQLLDSFLQDERITMYPESLKFLQHEAAPHEDEIWQVCEQHLTDLRSYLSDCQGGFPMKLFYEFGGSSY